MTFFFGFVGACSSAASAAEPELEGAAEASMSFTRRGRLTPCWAFSVRVGWFVLSREHPIRIAG
jgi:hypothetical protein